MLSNSLNDCQAAFDEYMKTAFNGKISYLKEIVWDAWKACWDIRQHEAVAHYNQYGELPGKGEQPQDVDAIVEKALCDTWGGKLHDIDPWEWVRIRAAIKRGAIAAMQCIQTMGSARSSDQATVAPDQQSNSTLNEITQEKLVEDIAADICDTVSLLNGIDYTPQQWMGTARVALQHFRYHCQESARSEISGDAGSIELYREEEAHARTVDQRDRAQDAADEMASLILGDNIDWAFHDAKWAEAIEKLQDATKREYRKEEHPWAQFLHARMKCIHLYLDKGKSEEYVAEMLSCDAPQVNSIRGVTWDDWEKIKSNYIESGNDND
jgi:hypothetical protein